MTRLKKWLLGGALVLAVAGAAYPAWQYLKPKSLAEGFASGNGRIEAVEIDIATKSAGRISDILVNEGDFLLAGQVLGHMDINVLNAQRHEAEAELKGAIIGVDTAKSVVTQRQAEIRSTVAVVRQREAEESAASKRLVRTEDLAKRGTAALQTLDTDRANLEGSKAAVSAAEAQVAAAAASFSAAESQVIAAQSKIVGVQATIERIQADIDDSTLRSPRDGRVQYRIAQPGEVLANGGRVLNMVDLSDVYMTFFLPTADAGRVQLGTDVRLVLDALPGAVIPARATFVADVAQFTPKTVETEEDRQKLMFRVKAQISPELLKAHIRDVKTGLPGMAYIRLDPQVEWPAHLQSNLLQ